MSPDPLKPNGKTIALGSMEATKTYFHIDVVGRGLVGLGAWFINIMLFCDEELPDTNS